MAGITELFVERLPSGLEHQILDSDTNKNRPAWLELEVVNEKAGFLCFQGEDGTRTYYKKLFQQFYVPTDATSGEVIALHDHIADRWDNINTDNKEVAGFIRSKIIEYCGTAKYALDLFGGTGVIAENIADLCGQIDILDGSKKMLEVAKRKKGLEKATIICADLIKENPLNQRQYDLIVCCKGLHYYDDSKLDVLFGKMHNSQSDRGYLMVVGRTNPESLSKHYSIIESGPFTPNGESKSPLPFYIVQK